MPDLTIDTPNPILDANAAAKTLSSKTLDTQNLGGSVIEAGNAMGADAPALATRASTVRSKFDEALGGLLSDVDKTRGTINDAYGNINKSLYVPAIVGKVMGFFGDQHLDADAQKLRIDQAAKDLELSNQRVKALATAADSSQLAADTALRGRATAFNTQLAGNQETRANIEAGIRLTTFQQSQAKVALEGLTDAQLAAAATDPTKVANIPGATPGMVKDVLQQKQAANIALSSAEELYRSHKMMNQKGALELGQEQIRLYLQNASTADFKRMQEEAATTGYANLPFPGPEGNKLRIPDIQFKEMAMARTEREAKFAKDTNEISTATVSNPIESANVANSLSRLASNTQASAYVGTPEYNNILTKTNVANTLTQRSDANSQLTASQLYGEVNKQIQAIQADIIAKSPKEAQQGLQEHFNTGRINGAEAASGVLVSSIKSSVDSPLSSDPFGYKDADALARVGFQQLQQKQANPLAGLKSSGSTAIPGNILDAATKLKMSDGELFEKMIADPTIGPQVKSKLVGGLQNGIIFNALKYLSTDFPDRPGIAAFKNVFQNGDFRPDLVHGGAVDISKLLVEITKTDPQASDILIGHLNDRDNRRRFQQFDENTHNTPEHAAYRARFFQNDFNPIFSALVKQIVNTQGQIKVQDASKKAAAVQALETTAEKTNAAKQPYDPIAQVPIQPLSTGLPPVYDPQYQNLNPAGSLSGPSRPQLSTGYTPYGPIPPNSIDLGAPPALPTLDMSYRNLGGANQTAPAFLRQYFARPTTPP